MMSPSKERNLPVFHLAFPIRDVPETVTFYREKLGFPIDIVEEKRCIINLFGHQAVAHVSEKDVPERVVMYPRHFGVILDRLEDFEALIQKAEREGIEFFQKRMKRFPGTPREHQTFFLKDPSNNLLEFKWYQNSELLFKGVPGAEQPPLHPEG